MFYFAYGSNMNYKQMRNRCPDSQFIRRAYLEGYRFIYDGYSSYREGAVANILKEKGYKVWGALYEINDTCLKELDNYEGYPDFYKREILYVKGDDGKEYKAWVYLREPRRKGRPSENYRNIIIEGAKDCGLPDDYIREFIIQEGLTP